MSSRRGLMFRLGQFFGHVARGAVGPLPGDGGQRREVSRTVEERTVPGEGGTMTLRRTTIDEVEIRPASAGSAGGRGVGAEAQQQGGQDQEKHA